MEHLISSVYRHARLSRTFPGERQLRLGPLLDRLHGRDKELRQYATGFAGKVKLKDRRVRPTRHTIEPEPNAPLLIRIVKYPYQQEVSYARRRRVYEPSMVVRDRLEPRPTPVADVREFRDQGFMGNPVKAIDLHPAPLPPPPPVDAWLSSVTRDVDARPQPVGEA